MNSITNELPLWLFLWRLPGVGAVTFHRLLQHNNFNQHNNATDDLFDRDLSPNHSSKTVSSLQCLWQQSDLQLKSLGLKPNSLSLLRQVDFKLLRSLPQSTGPTPTFEDTPAGKLKAGVCRDLQWQAQADHHLIIYNDPRYPALLKEISSPPPVLFVKGNVDLLSFPQLAIVGSRHATRPGLQNTRLFTTDLVKRGYAITSGLALGVDAQAHQACLEQGGQTLAVVGSGLDILYPKQNQALAGEIAKHGAVVSEFPIGTGPVAKNFPRRNRIISGLSIGTLVVEATERSGSLITARLAAEQGREVFAIPGSIHNAQSRGCHLLIKQGATLVQGSEDIIEHLAGLTLYLRDAHKKGPSIAKGQLATQPSNRAGELSNPLKMATRSQAEVKQIEQKSINNRQKEEGVEVIPPSQSKKRVTGEQEIVMNLLGECPTPIDRLVEQSTLTVQNLSSLLITLQLEGIVESKPGGYVLSNVASEA